MFIRRAALRPVPAFAIVGNDVIESIERMLDETDEDEIQRLLDHIYQDLDRQQPALSRWLHSEVFPIEDELAKSLGYFLAVTSFMAFREAFPTRLTPLDDGALTFAHESLDTDIALRNADPLEPLASDEVLAVHQPALMEFVRFHFHQALAQAEDTTNREELERAYRAALVTVIGLSDSVRSPASGIHPLQLPS